MSTTNSAITTGRIEPRRPRLPQIENYGGMYAFSFQEKRAAYADPARDVCLFFLRERGGLMQNRVRDPGRARATQGQQGQSRTNLKRPAILRPFRCSPMGQDNLKGQGQPVPPRPFEDNPVGQDSLARCVLKRTTRQASDNLPSCVLLRTGRMAPSRQTTPQAKGAFTPLGGEGGRGRGQIIRQGATRGVGRPKVGRSGRQGGQDPQPGRSGNLGQLAELQGDPASRRPCSQEIGRGRGRLVSPENFFSKAGSHA